MAAFWNAHSDEPAEEVIELRRLGPGALDALLEEEVRSWRERLHWDFRPSAELVQRYVAMRALDGLALFVGAEVAGYVYWVQEDRKALLGDLYVRAHARNDVRENLLLSGALARLTAGPHFTSSWIRRVEAQLMGASIRAAGALPDGPRPAGFRRLFMLAPLEGWRELPRLPLVEGLQAEHFGPRWMDEAAALVARVYAGHVDSEINDQYRTVTGAGRFLQNVVQYPGCGIFRHDCSFVALDETRRVQGLCLASQVSPESGHIAQICVDRSLHGRGAGYELLRCSMAAMAGCGLSEVSLTVTERNAQALALYRRTGFRTIHEFDALVWDGLSR